MPDLREGAVAGDAAGGDQLVDAFGGARCAGGGGVVRHWGVVGRRGPLGEELVGCGAEAMVDA